MNETEGRKVRAISWREQLLAAACVAILILAAFLAAYSGSSSTSQRLPNVQLRIPEPNKAQSPQNLSSPHLASSASDLGKGNADTENVKENGTEFFPSVGGYRLKVTDVLVALFTALLFFATLALWWATRRLVQDAKETSRTQLRAFVFLRGFEQGINIVRDVPHPYVKEFVFFANIENVGLTPARDVKAAIKSQTLPLAENREPHFEWELNKSGSIVLGPQGKGITTYHPIPIETMIELWKMETEIYVAARIEYRDEFDPSVIHYHEQCVMLDLLRPPDVIDNSPNIAPVTMRAYGPQNSSG